MKTNVQLPEIPKGIDPGLKRFCTDTLQIIKDLRLETANAMPVHIEYVDADYTIEANSNYTEYQVDNSSADVDITFPLLAEISFDIVPLDNSYDVNCNAAGSDTINGASSVTINRTLDRWKFSGGETEWKATSKNQCYDTGWLLNQIGGVGSPDWTNVHLGDDPSQDSNVNHNLDAPSSDLLIKILVSTDGTDNNSFEPVLSASDWDPVSTRSYGITIFQVDSNNITVQTGNDGILYIKMTELEML